MTAKAIGELLKGDTTSSSAATLFAMKTNPAITSPNQIPPYLYTCLSDIFLGAGQAAGWPEHVQEKYGVETTQAFGIDLIYQPAESVYMAQNKDKSDTIGAQFAVLRILCHAQNVTSASVNMIEQASLRVWYLIDCLNRTKWATMSPPPVSIGGTGPVIDTTTFDTSLDPSRGLYCRFLQDDLSLQDARMQATLYSLNYYRLTGV